MKKSIIRLALAMILMLNIAAFAVAQQAAIPKDTINADKAAKPVFYQAAEEEKSSEGCSPIVYVVGAVIVVAGVALILRKKKK
jgi:hypothetical protein